MNRFNVNLVEVKGDVHIYTDIKDIVIDEDKIVVDYITNDGEYECAVHDFDDMDEIVIKRNH